jgi:hypothetical protein
VVAHSPRSADDAKSIRLTSVAALAAMAALFAVPAVAQSSVPPIKRFPNEFENGVKLGPKSLPNIMFEAISLESEVLKNLTCQSVWTGSEWNETTEGTEKGLSRTTDFMTFQCKAENPCKVINTKGEEVEGIFLTAEAPPSPKVRKPITPASRVCRGSAKLSNEKQHATRSSSTT